MEKAAFKEGEYAREQRAGACPPPLCVDLDGTLTPSDTLAESFCILLKQTPLALFLLPFWLLRGRAYLKHQIAARVCIDPARLPWNEALLAALRQEQASGRQLFLVTAADKEIAHRLHTQAHRGLFEEAIGSDGCTNLKGEEKAALLVQRFGPKGFDYAGNSRADLPVWKAARKAWVVSGSSGMSPLVQQARAVADVDRHFPVAGAKVADWARALRLHQWSKNALLLLPLIGAHLWGDPHALALALIGFLAFSFGASSVYLLNDLLDLDADRQHPTKHRRPFASGRLPIIAGLIASPLLLGAALALCACLNWRFAATFGVYYLVTGLYSWRLKQVPLLDVFVLAGLYGLRVQAGGVAVGAPVSQWLLLFSMFLFLSLAFVKRFTELDAQSGSGVVQGRGYIKEDAPLVSIMGLTSGYLCVLVLALYVNHSSITELYRAPDVLWFACPLLLYWVSRIWLLTHRGMMHDDPIYFALKDRQSWIILAALVAVGLAALPK